MCFADTLASQCLEMSNRGPSPLQLLIMWNIEMYVNTKSSHWCCA